MTKVVLVFNMIVIAWFGVELVEFYGANRFVNDYMTGFMVHDAFMPVVVAFMNTMVIIGLGFNVNAKSDKTK